jgi:hypothetical protein
MGTSESGFQAFHVRCQHRVGDSWQVGLAGETRERIPGFCRMVAITSAASAICGTHLGETNEVASTTGIPAAASLSMSCTLMLVGISCFSFCSPSLAPTSTMRTRDGRGVCQSIRCSAYVLRAECNEGGAGHRGVLLLPRDTALHMVGNRVVPDAAGLPSRWLLRTQRSVDDKDKESTEGTRSFGNGCRGPKPHPGMAAEARNGMTDARASGPGEGRTGLFLATRTAFSAAVFLSSDHLALRFSSKLHLDHDCCSARQLGSEPVAREVIAPCRPSLPGHCCWVW